MVFDFLEHNYSNTLIQGHCIPGGPSTNYVACTTARQQLHLG